MATAAKGDTSARALAPVALPRTAIAKAKSAYSYFQQDYYATRHGEEVSLSAVAAAWREAPPSIRNKFEILACQDRERFEKESHARDILAEQEAAEKRAKFNFETCVVTGKRKRALLSEPTSPGERAKSLRDKADARKRVKN